MHRRTSLIVVAVALAVGAALAAGVGPSATGSWQCFRTDQFPDPTAEPGRVPSWNPASAAGDHTASVFAGGLDKIAGNSAAGTVFTVQLSPPIGRSFQAICVKH